jgi:hypothetical protein
VYQQHHFLPCIDLKAVGEPHIVDRKERFTETLGFACSETIQNLEVPI